MTFLKDAWVYEAVRLSETQSGWVDDSVANREAVAAASGGLARLWLRAKRLAPTLGLAPAIAQVSAILKLSAVALGLVAFLTGISAGLAALGDAQLPVNVVWAWLALLLLPSLSFVLWLGSFFLPQSKGGLLGQGWEWLANRWLRQAKTAVAWRAWLTVAEQRGAQRWWLALITHGVWIALLTGMTLALLVAFSLRHYTFVWQTTWLEAEAFVQFARAVGAWPAWLGFKMPEAQTILLSGNLAIDQPDVRSQWAHWLVGSVCAWGLLPRIVAMLVSAWRLRQCYGCKTPQPSDAYALVVLARLDKTAQTPKVDGEPGPTDRWPTAIFLEDQYGSSAKAVVPIETAPLAQVQTTWGAQVTALTPIEDRASLQQAKSQLQALSPQRLLIVADAQHTPDRGVINTILALTPYVVQARVYLKANDSSRNRVTQWQAKLDAIGMVAPLTKWSQVVHWMNAND